MVEILTWISIITGGVLILMMLMSIIGGLDFDLDLDVGSSDIETDAGGIGIIKGLLTFISVCTWMIKVLIVGGQNFYLATAIGIACGMLAVGILAYVFKLLLKGQENVNWEIKDALFKTGEVYLKIPAGNGTGLIQVNINGANRELKANSIDNKEIATGEKIVVMEVDGDIAKVQKEN